MTEGSGRVPPSVVRLIAAAALVLGLVAMHGLVSDHHATGHATVTMTSHAGHVPAATAGQVVNDAATTIASAACTAGCGDSLPTTLCLAVLATAAACLLSERIRRRAPFANRSTYKAAFVALRRGPPPLDPVSQLCVSRT